MDTGFRSKGNTQRKRGNKFTVGENIEREKEGVELENHREEGRRERWSEQWGEGERLKVSGSRFTVGVGEFWRCSYSTLWTCRGGVQR